MKYTKFSSLLCSAILSVFISFAAFADDLEIYLGTGSSDVEYYPNVLFVMDTSGSMTNQDGTGQSRMLRVQNALKDALSSATNINAGLMRFSDFGGPVLFPVRGIDTPVSPELIVSVTQGQDDVFEIGGNLNMYSNTLQLTQGTGTVLTGLRFRNLNIPRSAVITGAFLRFSSEGLNSASSVLTIRAENDGDAPEFQNLSDNLSTRTLTSNEVIWDSENNWPLSGETISSPDFTNVIQEVIDRADWCGGNDLNLIIEGTSLDGTSARLATSIDEGTGLSPQIVITYDESSATGCIRDSMVYQVDQQDENAEEKSNGYQSTGSELTFINTSNAYIGLRFKNIALPQNASVLNAYLEFTAYQTNTGGVASMTIEGVNENDPSDFSPYNRYMLRDKPKTAAVNWTGIGPWYRNQVYQSPPVTNIVQQIVNRSGWNINNEMMFVLSDFTSNKRGAYTYNGKPSGAARLVIEFEAAATPGTSSTVREHLMSKVDELSASGLTPIVDTLYEASLYYGGDDVYYGLKRGESSVSSTVRRNTRVSHRSSYVGDDPIRPSGCEEDNLSDSDCINEQIPSGARYISPIVDLQCQTNNHIVLLSDGVANNNHSVDEIEALLGTTCSGSGGERCGLDLVKNIADKDRTAIDARVITHTIGFAANAAASNFLNKIALESGGGFYEADNSTDLVTAFQTILRNVKDVNATFVSPGVAVNQLNRLTHRDELYFALFKPAEGAVWPGNLKKYKISGDEVLDKNGINAVDSTTGFFSENAHSYWSPLADGNDVREGGAASRLDLVRRSYTFNSTGNIFTTANELSESNTNITEEDLNVHLLADSATLRETVLKWARGVDVRDEDGDGSSTDVRIQMGDPIHSQPVIVNYSATDSAIFVATNHGFLHSFDAETGEENFSIIPKELLANLYDFYRDGSSFNHIYGLDGDLVLRHFDDKIYLYVGMRRGGNNYYVFDVTTKLSPKLVFKIDGGSGDFANMGQTWSRPTITKVRMGSVVKNVMIVGGGYDEDQDDKTNSSEDNIGNSVYMIDADSGELLWAASNANADLIVPEMTYSIPARISVIDRDSDGFADHMYVADMGAQLFRFDIYNGKTGSEFIRGAELADFNSTEAENNRRFYYGPDVSEVSLGDEHYFAVAIGSGFRAGPLNTVVDDRFYMVKDTGVFKRDESGLFTMPSTTTLSESNLYDATEHLLNSSDETQRELENTLFASKNGWMMRLTDGGEKVLASPLILDYKVFFTTYLPASASISACAPPTGNSRAYLVNLINGNAVGDINLSETIDKEDRSAQLAQTGIAPDTKILIENIVKPVVCLGAECVSAVIEVDENGDEVACVNGFECLAQNIYGRFERLQKNTWTTEVERN
jgi:type IV pilus assembly protein PilY1